VLDFIEITFVVVPIVAPILLTMGIDPVWLGVMIAINLQTSFLTPPFGFALFYLRGVAPPSVETSAIYLGVVPFVVIQLVALALLALFPELATWLPDVVYGP
jgi:TRAP-type mannitol/chloroaromatic compound transport system permease large subunit